MSTEVAELAIPAPTVSESSISTAKVASNVSLATQPHAVVEKSDHLPKRTAVLKKSQPAKPEIRASKRTSGVKTSKVLKSADHPRYVDMVVDAIKTLGVKKGSSRAAIVKYILGRYNVGSNISLVRKHVNNSLALGMENGTFKNSSNKGKLLGCFRVQAKLPSGDAVAKKTATPKRKPIAKKTKSPVAKKLTAKESTKAPKEKSVASLKKTTTEKTDTSTPVKKSVKAKTVSSKAKSVSSKAKAVSSKAKAVSSKAKAVSSKAKAVSSKSKDVSAKVEAVPSKVKATSSKARIASSSAKSTKTSKKAVRQ